MFHGNVETGVETFKQVLQTATSEQCGMFGMICWGLWVRRNKWVWSSISISVFGIRQMAVNLLSNWNRANEHEIQHQNKQVQIKIWTKPIQGWIKININAACDPADDFVGIGCVVRDANGCFLRARNEVIRGARSPRDAEALSMREALSWIKDWRRNNCVFESDSKLLIDALSEQTGNSLFHTFVEDCSELATNYENVLFMFVQDLRIRLL